MNQGEAAESPRYEGGCLCGALRYVILGEPLDAGYCHCRLCQRSAGAPVLAWATIPAEVLSYVRGTPRVYPSSERGRRYFCQTCGTQLCFRISEDSSTLDINIVTLDDPSAIIPQYHIWSSSRIPWFDTRDDLPRHPDGGPDTWT